MDEQQTLFDRLPDSMKHMVKKLSDMWYKVGYNEALSHCVNALLESGKTIDEAKEILNISDKDIEILKESFLLQNKK